MLEGDELVADPQGNDRAQVKAIKEGVCDLAIGNTYYYGKMLDNEFFVSLALQMENDDAENVANSAVGGSLEQKAKKAG